MKKIVLQNGLIGGLIVASTMLISVYKCYSEQNFEPSYVIGFGGMALAFLFVFLGTKQYRDYTESSITFGKMFKVAFLIALLIATIYVAVWMIVYKNFFPDFMERFSEISLKKLQDSGANAQEISAKTVEMNQMKEWYKNPLSVILLTYMEILPMGLIISLISALIFMRKKK